jgi:hypothetical protein
MIDEWLYDKNGDAKLYLEEDKFMSNDQRIIGTLDGEDVYAVSGEYIGSFIKGVIYDTDDRIVALTEHAQGYVPTGDDVFGSPTMPDVEYAPNGLGLSGNPVNPVHGGWSDETLDDFFGVEL